MFPIRVCVHYSCRFSHTHSHHSSRSKQVSRGEGGWSLLAGVRCWWWRRCGPPSPFGGWTLVLQKSAAKPYSFPSGAANQTILSGSASQPSQRAMAKALCWASHFLPFSALTPSPCRPQTPDLGVREQASDTMVSLDGALASAGWEARVQLRSHACVLLKKKRKISFLIPHPTSFGVDPKFGQKRAWEPRGYPQACPGDARFPGVIHLDEEVLGISHVLHRVVFMVLDHQVIWGGGIGERVQPLNAPRSAPGSPIVQVAQVCVRQPSLRRNPRTRTLPSA